MENKFRINKDKTSWKDVDGEIVLLNLETSVYYSLNDTGTFLWKKLINSDLSLSEIVNLVSIHYSVEKEFVNKDITEIIKMLVDESLLIELEI